MDQVIIEVAGAGGLARTASGEVARRLGEAFVAARDALGGLGPGGAILLRCTGSGPALVGAVGSLCRSLAREAAPHGVRVNAIVAAPRAEVAGLVSFLGSPAGLMCTGAVFQATRADEPEVPHRVP